MRTIARKYLVDKHAVCSDCGRDYYHVQTSDEGVDAWAKRHALETGHIVSIEELHDVYAEETAEPACTDEKRGQR